MDFGVCARPPGTRPMLPRQLRYARKVHDNWWPRPSSRRSCPIDCSPVRCRFLQCSTRCHRDRSHSIMRGNRASPTLKEFSVLSELARRTGRREMRYSETSMNDWRCCCCRQTLMEQWNGTLDGDIDIFVFCMDIGIMTLCINIYVQIERTVHSNVRIDCVYRILEKVHASFCIRSQAFLCKKLAWTFSSILYCKQ